MKQRKTMIAAMMLASVSAVAQADTHGDFVNAVIDLTTAQGAPVELAQGAANDALTPSEVSADNTHDGALDIVLTGTVPAKQDICTISVSGLDFNFGSGTAWGVFTGQSAAQSFNIACGSDRDQPAAVHMSTASTDPEINGNGSDTIAGTFNTTGGDAVAVTYNLEVDFGNTGSYTPLGQTTEYGVVAAGTSKPVKIRASVDKELLREGGTLSHDGSPFVYLWLR